jgi:hypothetical protein
MSKLDRQSGTFISSKTLEFAVTLDDGTPLANVILVNERDS